MGCQRCTAVICWLIMLIGACVYMPLRVGAYMVCGLTRHVRQAIRSRTPRRNVAIAGRRIGRRRRRRSRFRRGLVQCLCLQQPRVKRRRSNRSSSSRAHYFAGQPRRRRRRECRRRRALRRFATAPTTEARQSTTRAEGACTTTRRSSTQTAHTTTCARTAARHQTTAAHYHQPPTGALPIRQPPRQPPPPWPDHAPIWTQDQLYQQAQRMKGASAGPDGWSGDEIFSCPPRIWGLYAQFLQRWQDRGPRLAARKTSHTAKKAVRCHRRRM